MCAPSKLMEQTKTLPPTFYRPILSTLGLLPSLAPPTLAPLFPAPPPTHASLPFPHHRPRAAFPRSAGHPRASSAAVRRRGRRKCLRRTQAWPWGSVSGASGHPYGLLRPDRMTTPPRLPSRALGAALTRPEVDEARPPMGRSRATRVRGFLALTTTRDLPVPSAISSPPPPLKKIISRAGIVDLLFSS